MRWELGLAWCVAATCSLLALRLLRGLRRSSAPAPTALLDELLGEVGAESLDSEFVRRSAIADLNQRLSDVAFELESLPPRFTSLSRICLASGTALALFGYIGASSDLTGGAGTPLQRVFGLAMCAAAGLVGAAVVFGVGRMAKQRSSAIREEWDRSSRAAGRALGTSLEAPVRTKRADYD